MIKKTKCKKCLKQFEDYQSRLRKFCSSSCANSFNYKGNLEKYRKRGENHRLWKGADVGYVALHGWVRRNLTPPDRCPDCGYNGRLDAVNLDRKYTRDLNTWAYKCRSCHKKYDLKLLGKSAGYKESCVNGHKYTPENTGKHRITGYVYCKTCNRSRIKLDPMIRK